MTLTFNELFVHICFHLLQSVENCTCILHNLTYQLEQECPESFTIYDALDEGDLGSEKSSTVGCFSSKSSKLKKKVAINHNAFSPLSD